MALIRRRTIDTRKEAIEVLLNDLYLPLNAEVVEWFSYAQSRFPKSERDDKSKDIISKLVRKEFSRNAHWSGEWHYLTVAHIKFVTRSYPYFDFVLDLYLVASVEAEWHKDYSRSFSERCIILEPIKKEIEKFQIPLDFLGGS